MRLPEPYRLADKTIAELNKDALCLVRKTKQRLIVKGFDELNVLREIDTLYAELDRSNRKRFKELFIARYMEIMAYLGKKPDEDTVDELAEMYVAGLLDEPNETTQYTYATEVLRKRDRAKEAMLSVPTRQFKQVQLDKHVRYFQQMTGWFTDFTSQGAEIEAYKNAGIKKVQRHEHDDEKTCFACRKADGEIYDINKIPPMPHLNCRRTFTPVV